MAPKADTKKQWYMATVQETCAAFDVSIKTGLSTEQVRERSKKGKKAKAKTTGKYPRISAQYWAVLLIMSVLSVSVYMLESTTAVLIFMLCVCVLTAFGLSQQAFVKHILLVLAKPAPMQVSVRRAGSIVTVAAQAVVPGDIFVLHEGDYVPADIRLLEVKNLYADERSVLSQVIPELKNTFTLHKKTKPEAQKNMIAAGSFIHAGSGVGIAVSEPELTVDEIKLSPRRLHKKQQTRIYIATFAAFLLGLTVIIWKVSVFASIGLSALLAYATYHYALYWFHYVTWATLYDQGLSMGAKFKDFDKLHMFVKTDMVFLDVPSDFVEVVAFIHQLQAELRVEVRPLVKKSDVKKLEQELNIQDSALSVKDFMNATRANKIKKLNEYQLLVGFDDVAVAEAVSLMKQTGHTVAWVDESTKPNSASDIADIFISQTSEPSVFLQAKSDIAYSKRSSLKRLAALVEAKTRFKNMTAY